VTGTLTTPLLGVVVIRRLGFDTFYMCAKFDDRRLSRFRDIVGAPKFKVGQLTQTTPYLRVICHQYAGT